MTREVPHRGWGERLLRLVPPVRRSLDEVPAHAAAWDRANAALLERGPGSAPCWLVLGDSTAQAVGLRDIADGYVGRTRRLLEQRDGTAWEVLNLSRSGAVVGDVLERQLPRLHGLLAGGWRPRLVSAAVGGNDLRKTSQPVLLQQLPRLVAALPARAAVATLPRGLREPRAREANTLLREQAAARDLVLVDLWATTGPPWRGKYADGLHPGPAGVTEWVRAFALALDLPAEDDPPTVRPRRRAR